MDSPLVERLHLLRQQLPPAVQLLAVSKGRPAAEIRELYAAGQRSFGENRLQEAQAKQLELRDLLELDWHFIGRIQANKVRPLLASFGTFHGVDSAALAERISRIAQEEGHRPRLYAQVKLLPDATKTGFDPGELRRLWPQLRALPALSWLGVMLMPPFGLGAEALGVLYGQACQLGNELGLPGRSMGMSGDWPLAVAGGSTLVRIGGGLFNQFQNLDKIPPTCY